MRTSISPTQSESGRPKNDAPQDENDVGPIASQREEIEALKRSLQEQRRATTLLTAEVQKQTEAREALEAQLIEANAEIAASWDRRKEMTRVIADRDAKLAEALATIEGLAGEIETARARNKELTELRAEIKATRERRKEIAQVVANRDAKIAKLRADNQARFETVVGNRDAKIAQLKAELQARYEELAALQRHIAQSTLSAKTKRLVRPITRLLR